MMDRNPSSFKSGNTSKSSSTNFLSLFRPQLPENSYVPSLEPQPLNSKLLNNCKRLSTHLINVPIARPINVFKRDRPLSLMKQNKNVSFVNAVTVIPSNPGNASRDVSSADNMYLSDNTMKYFEKINQRSLPAFANTTQSSPMDWNTICGGTQIDRYRSKILILDKQLIDLQAKHLKMETEHQKQLEIIQSELEVKQHKIDELNAVVTTLHEKEIMFSGNVERLQNDSVLAMKNMDLQKVSYLKEISKLSEELQVAHRNEAKYRSSNFSEGSMLKHRIETLQTEQTKLLTELEKANKLVATYEEKMKQPLTIMPALSEESEIDQIKADLEVSKTQNLKLMEQLKEQGKLEEELVKQRTEVHRLKCQLKSSEETRKNEESCNVNPDEIAQMTKTITKLDELIQAKDQEIEKQKEQRNELADRLGKLSSSNRHTFSLLTGYKIHMLDEENYMLTHVYDPQSKRPLMIKMEKDKKHFHLQESQMDLQWCDSLRDKIKTYLEGEEDPSYPAFLSSITLDLYHDRKLKKYNLA